VDFACNGADVFQSSSLFAVGQDPIDLKIHPDV
jgi:hypothetical protein